MLSLFTVAEGCSLYSFKFIIKDNIFLTICQQKILVLLNLFFKVSHMSCGKGRAIEVKWIHSSSHESVKSKMNSIYNIFRVHHFLIFRSHVFTSYYPFCLIRLLNSNSLNLKLMHIILVCTQFYKIYSMIGHHLLKIHQPHETHILLLFQYTTYHTFLILFF